MIPGATRSRAAVLCFGGWGLQTMLHLAPRLQTAQDQRAATGVDGPDLTRITRFAALLPDDHLDRKGQLALNLFSLRDERLPPFYLERLLDDLERDNRGDTRAANGAPPEPACGAAQQRASLLLAAARESLLPLLEQGPVSSPLFSSGGAKAPRKGLSWPFRRASRAGHGAENSGGPEGAAQAASGVELPTRGHAFRAALDAGDNIAQIVASNIIDPIRADTLVPGDPFVQTTLYVIAPLFEPLTSALIWPAIAHQLNYLGQRHIAQVVGIFATGSYATDNSRVIEDASCYAAMAEMEAFTGLRPANLDKVVSSVRKSAGGRGGRGAPFPEDRLGSPLFDRIYLVDREKSNQGLARNSYELTVLVANTLQALIAADGAAYIDEQVGIDLRDASHRPYSLLGAAADHVPLDYILRAAQQEESKRLVREHVLLQPASAAAGQTPLAVQDPSGAGQTALASLYDLGATTQQALAHLIEQMPDLFGDLNPRSIHQLSAHPDYLLPGAAARKIRGQDPLGWQAAFDGRLQSMQARFDQETGPAALDAAWGLSGGDDGSGDSSQQADGGASLNSADNRFLPVVSRRMRAFLVTLMSAHPTGILQARRQLHHWLHALEQERSGLADDQGSGGRDPDPDSPRLSSRVERQKELRKWRNRYLRSLPDQPSMFGSLTRAFGLLGGVVLLTVLFLFAAGLVDRVIPDFVGGNSNPAMLPGQMLVVFVDALFDFLDNEANAATSIGLMVGAFLGATISYRSRYRRVQKLRRERVDLACAELSARLRQSARRGLDRVHDHLAQMLQQMDHLLEETCASLQVWSVSNDIPLLPPEGVISSHLYRPHINPTLWQLCQAFMRDPRDRSASGVHAPMGETQMPVGRVYSLDSIREGRLYQIWTSPQQRERLAALLDRPPSPPLAQSLAAGIRECAQAASVNPHLANPSNDEAETARLEFVRTLAKEYNLEHILWRDTSSTAATGSAGQVSGAAVSHLPSHQDGAVTPVSTATLRYLEGMWNAAKPSANYDVSDRMAAHGLPVEFAAVSGDPDSDLTENVMQSLRIPRLLTGDAFQIAFVRTLHGLALKDLGSMSRYLGELSRMNPSARRQILLTDTANAELYNQRS